jgi:hypothetical protein
LSLTVLITDAAGKQYRCAPDEPDAGWVPQNIQWGTALPGGDKEASFDLARRADDDVPLRLFDEVQIIDEHGQEVYGGRIHQLPREHGEDFKLGAKCLGWAAHLLDDTSVPYFFVDRAMSGWGEPSLLRRLALANAFTPMGKIPSQTAQAGGIAWTPPNEALPTAETSELWLDTGHDIAFMSYIGTRTGAFTNFEPPTLYGGDSVDASSGPTYALTLNGLPQLVGLTETKRALMLRCTTTAPVTPAAGHLQKYDSIGVYGNHGIPGTGMPDGHYGYYIDEMLADALSVGAPKINFTTGSGGTIERPDLVVGQASDGDVGSIDRIILDLNKYVIWDWLVYGKTFYYRPTDPDRLTWEARLDQGVLLSLEGDDAEHAFNGVMVKYQLLDGTKRVAGPAGSGLDVESALLGDTDPENTVNAHGYTKKYAELNIQFPLAADVYATTIGAAYLAQVSLPSRSGDITLTGHVEHPTKGLRPVREVRSGDWIRLSDHPADVPRRIIQTSYTEDARQCRVSVGNEVAKVDALLERLGIDASVRVGV